MKKLDVLYTAIELMLLNLGKILTHPSDATPKEDADVANTISPHSATLDDEDPIDTL